MGSVRELSNFNDTNMVLHKYTLVYMYVYNKYTHTTLQVIM